MLPKLIADALIGLALESGGKLRDVSALSSFIQQAVSGDEEALPQNPKTPCNKKARARVIY